VLWLLVVLLSLAIAWLLGWELTKRQSSSTSGELPDRDLNHALPEHDAAPAKLTADEVKSSSVAVYTPAVLTPAVDDAPATDEVVSLLPAAPAPEVIPEVAAVSGAAVVAEPPRIDDLTKIEGIGPKINGLLHEAGIHTFAKLAQTDVAQLRTILLAAKLRVNNPATWPEQAALAADGKWAELAALQDGLTAGRKV
jgi:predicted flap endonuclease-1-like 5' DNA nuclease